MDGLHAREVLAGLVDCWVWVALPPAVSRGSASLRHLSEGAARHLRRDPCACRLINLPGRLHQRKALLARRIHSGAFDYGRQIGTKARARVCLLNALPECGRRCAEDRSRCSVDRLLHSSQSRVGIKDEEGGSRGLRDRMCWVARMMKMCCEGGKQPTKVYWQGERLGGCGREMI
jgi:hypothetical protein